MRPLGRRIVNGEARLRAKRPSGGPRLQVVASVALGHREDLVRVRAGAAGGVVGAEQGALARRRSELRRRERPSSWRLAMTSWTEALFVAPVALSSGFPRPLAWGSEA